MESEGEGEGSRDGSGDGSSGSGEVERDGVMRGTSRLSTLKVRGGEEPFVPLSGLKQNRGPSDYLEKFEEYKKRRGEQEGLGAGGHGLGGTGVGAGFGTAPGSEAKRTLTKVGSRSGGGGALRVKTKGKAVYHGHVKPLVGPMVGRDRLQWQ